MDLEGGRKPIEKTDAAGVTQVLRHARGPTSDPEP